MTCEQGLLRLLWGGGPKLECYGTDIYYPCARNFQFVVFAICIFDFNVAKYVSSNGGIALNFVRVSWSKLQGNNNFRSSSTGFSLSNILERSFTVCTIDFKTYFIPLEIGLDIL